jgi:hypothetical protein
VRSLSTRRSAASARSRARSRSATGEAPAACASCAALSTPAVTIRGEASRALISSGRLAGRVDAMRESFARLTIVCKPAKRPTRGFAEGKQSNWWPEKYDRHCK